MLITRSLQTHFSSLLSQLLLLIGLSFATSHCGTDAPTSSTKAVVDSTDAQKAFGIIETIDYLPFANIVDGCYARAYYMAMELAAEHLPSSIQYARAVSGALSPRPDIHWSYHVAPMLWVENAVEPTVIDPSMSNVPLPRSDWIADLKPEGEVELFWAEGSQFIYHRDPKQMGPDSKDYLIRTFDELHSFKESDIGLACGYMESFLNSEPGVTPAESQRKIDKLHERTNQLHEALYYLGKIEGITAPGRMSCR